MKNTKVQWHPGFVAAMNLELAENRNDLAFEKEYNLNTRPLEIDLLVVRKNTETYIDNEIGHIFREYNIMEYKSPEDHLDIDAFYKAGAYASLYKSYGNGVDSIKADNITVSLVRDSRPEGLFRYLKRRCCPITNPYPGIYYVKGEVLFPTQVVVTKELSGDAHIWLKALSEEISRKEMEELLGTIRRLEGRYDRELADSVLEVSIRANARRIEKWKGDGSMGQALMELMKPQLLLMEQEAVQRGMQKGIQKGIQQGMQQGIQGTVEILRGLGHEKEEIKKIIEKQYHLTEKESGEYL